jgi:predicted amidohydrolase
MTRTVRIALLQLPAFSIEQAEASLAHTMRRIDETVAREKPDLVALPEVTYPGYFLGTDDLSTRDVLTPAEAARQFAEKARQHGIYLAVGLAMDAPGGGYTNAAALFGRDGSLAGRYDKSFLWHFDTRWFEQGSAYPVFETDIGRIGMLICADGRLPEIARSLTLNGAQIILDLTAWVSGGRNSTELSTTQITHLMRARAAENGVWVACADKSGSEAESIVYAGHSCFINPHGEIVATLGPDEDAALVYDVPVADAALPIERRPEMYEVLSHPTESLPVIRTLSESLVPQEHEKRIAVVQMTMPSTGAEFVVQARRHVERQALMDASIVAFPATPSRYRHDYGCAEVIEGMRQIAADTGVMIAFVVWDPDGNGHRTMYLLGPRGVIGAHRQSHKPPGGRFEKMPLGDEVCPVLTTAIGRVGLMLAADGYVPEVARSLMLRGAEIILWSGDDPGLAMAPVARTRAEENRIFVASAAAPSASGATLIADPNGRLLAVALDGQELCVAAEVNRALSHIKERAPGTDVVRNRQPATYGAITRVPAGVGGGRSA